MAEEKKVEEKSTEEHQEEVDDTKLVLRAKNLYQQAVDYRRKIDWEWLVRSLYMRGYHFAKYNRGTNTVIFSSRTGVRIPINLVAAHMRGVRNQVTSFQPKWEVLPNVTTESAIENARYSGKVLDYIYEKAQIKRKIKEVVNDGLWSSIGIWQFTTSSDGMPVVNRIDPFDFWVDPNCKSSNLSDPDFGAEFIDHTMQMSLDAIRKHKKFEHTDELNADNKIAAAEYKQFLMQATRNRYEAKSEDNETAIVHRSCMRERDDNGKIRIRVIHWTEHISRPLLKELFDSPEYDYEILQGDITAGELYGESWIKHLIPVNRVIDALESHVFEYNHFFAKGRFVIDKNSGVRVIVNQHGQIIEKNRGAQVASLPITPLPPSPENQIMRMKAHLEDISGVHDVSLGRLPGTLRSGVAIAELRQSDATNQSDLVDNLEDFLSRAGRKILKIVAENWTTSKLISVTGLGGKPEYFMAAGDSSKLAKDRTKEFTFGSMKLPLAIIGADNEVRVQVGSWLAYTKEARMEKLKELFRLGAIDQKTYLEYAEFADIDGIVERTRTERIMQMRAGEPSRAVERQYGVQLSDEEVALAENELMLEGVEQMVDPNDDHSVHISIHKEHEENDMVRAHLNEHIKIQRWESAMISQPMGGDQAGGEGAPPTGAPSGEAPPPSLNGMAASQGMPTPNFINAIGGGQ